MFALTITTISNGHMRGEIMFVRKCLKNFYACGLYNGSRFGRALCALKPKKEHNLKVDGDLTIDAIEMILTCITTHLT